MPDTGAPWNIPYVAGTDLVADWPTDSQTLAEAIADGLDAAGKIAQVVQTVKDDTFSASSVAVGGTTTVTGLSVSITPESASNKVLILASINVSTSAGAVTRGVGVILERGGSPVGVGAAASNRTPVTSAAVAVGTYGQQNATIMYLDSPATTSATTYSVDIMNAEASVRNLFVNRTDLDLDVVQTPRAVSTITAIEVKA